MVPKVSVIITIYNREKYIEDCARTLFEQTLDDVELLFVDDAFLGNVYTQYYHYHKDFGTIGVFVILTIIAFTSMFMYNRALDTLNNPLEINCWLLIYSMTAFHLFMSFFSARYTIGLFHWGFVTNMIFIWLESKWLSTFIKNENAKTMAIAAAISNRKRPLLRRRVYSTFLLPCLCLFYHGHV